MTEQLIPPPPAYPPAVGVSAPDWWDALYPDDEPPSTRPAAPWLPDWRKPKPSLPTLDPDQGQELEEPEDDEPPAEDDEHSQDDAEDEQPEEEPAGPERPRRQRAPHRHLDAVLDTVTSDPKRRHRLEVLAYNGTAAGAGWRLGIGPWLHDSLVFYGQHDTPNGVFVGCGVIAVAAVAEVRSHNWRGPDNHVVMRLLGWLARIPLATAVLALALYTPDARF
ncbi:hypothetical protein ABZ442_04950 [Streptomyces triculaminicus]|uniref:hypothetical protein n=1 Tax=Streptomyces triculaminicus TaxID=2816232 RepID=UPI0033F429B1